MMYTQNQVSWPDWEVVRKIGSGSFGTVYEIQKDIRGYIEKAALKVITIPHNQEEVDYLRCSGLDDANITQTFQQQVENIATEYTLVAQLRDNYNIVRSDEFREIQHDDGLGWDIYIKMELLTPLMKCLDRVSTEPQIIQLGMDICNALIACQRKNIIHRDIKPQNIFISETGNFKLGDFGIARTIERATHATAGIGTYSYMAPEVECDETYGKTVDIYSLGLTMYWLLNDRRGPFMPLPPNIPKFGDEEKARRRRFSGEPIQPPKNGSEGLKAIVLRACSFRPEDRFASAEEFYAALADLQGIPYVATGVNILAVDAVSDYEDTTAKEKTIEENTQLQEPEDDATVGPGWKGKAAGAWSQEIEDDDATVGPMLAKKDFVVAKVKETNVVTEQKADAYIKNNTTEEKFKHIGTLLPNGFWKCICGRINAAYVSSCVCGINKSEIKLVHERSNPAQTQLTRNDLRRSLWRCVCGRTNATNVSVCVCGKSKDKPVCESAKTIQTQPTRNDLCKENWKCSCGRANARYVSTCVCGMNKSELNA